MNEMTVIKVTDEQAPETFRKLYEGSALTFAGIIPEEAHLYRDHFKAFTEIDETRPCYMYTGKQMNRHYGLKGRNAYKARLCFVSFTLDTFKDVTKIAIPRFQIGGRWFDDIVENNKRHCA